jgi:preprotein translocase subunit SecD
VKRTRALWISILFVFALVVGAIALFATGTRPVLGLDLEGGVSVILSAPEGTPPEVMDQALENIRTRIDAFGTAEPILYVTGNNIEVQIPGLAHGTIKDNAKTQYCLMDNKGTSFGCYPQQDAATSALDGAAVNPITQSVCLTGDVFGDQPPCFGDEQAATTALDAIAVQKQQDQYCLTQTGLPDDPCFPTKDEANAALAGIATDVKQTYCVQTADGKTLTSDAGGACYPTEQEANDTLASLQVTKHLTEYCVVSSAGTQLGCYLSRDEAQARLQETGQERLLQVIGETARLEFREVLATIPPGSPEYDSTPVDCAEPTQLDTKACSFEALKDKEVVFYDKESQNKYKLGPVELTGEAIDKATAVYRTSSQSSVSQGWTIDFTLTGEGSSVFGDVTTRLYNSNGQLAIVVDRKVISAPTVDGPITGGNGVITGSFTENRAKDLATQLNAGALPVELTTQQVLTVSPTLGKESLDAGILAGLAGLALLFLYLLFYYRILALVAWLGMTIWAILALALVALAGQSFGYSLTLAGVAGLVISLGVTADSYIVFFERFKDEVHGGKTPRVAVQPAFKKAFRTIVAADVVTGLAALVLYLTAISSVRGFALTLGVAVVLDLFVVYFFKRPAVFLLARNERLVTMPVVGVTSGVSADHEALPAIAGGSK